MKKHWVQRAFLKIGLIGVLVMTGCGVRSEEALEKEMEYRQQGIEKLNAGYYEEAVDLFQQALDQSVAVVDELEIDICYYKAIAQYKAGDVQGAKDTYTALIEYDKENADALYLRGTLYLELGDVENAIKDYNGAIEKNKKNSVLYNEIAERLINAGHSTEAIKILEQALQVKGDEPEDYRAKGYSYYLMGEYDNARTYLDKAINMGDKDAVFYLAKMLETQGETEQSNQLYESYVAENSGNTELLNTLGCSRMEEGKYEQALVFFRKALENEHPVNEQELRRNEIIALENMLDFAQAKEKMESYVQDYPDDVQAAREYEFLKSR